MRILLINPNTTAAITERVRAAALEVAAETAPEACFTAVTGRFGCAYVASEAAYAIAGHAALDALATHVDGHDSVLLACFGDPGLRALRELSPVPVVGMAEAACLEACLMGERFAIVTGGARWRPMLERCVAGIGLAQRLAAVATVAPSGAEIARDPEAALASLEAVCLHSVQADGADVIVLAGAGLAGLARRLRTPVPVLCSTAVAVAAALRLARRSSTKPALGARAATPPVASTGLSPALARRLASPGEPG